MFLKYLKSFLFHYLKIFFHIKLKRNNPAFLYQITDPNVHTLNIFTYNIISRKMALSRNFLPGKQVLKNGRDSRVIPLREIPERNPNSY